MSDKKSFILSTDSSCDLPLSYYSDHNVAVAQLNYLLDDELYANFDKRMDFPGFYKAMREQKMPVTNQVNPEQLATIFEDQIKAGNDVLHIGFSSGLSGSCNSARIAMAEVLEKYPDAKIVVVDSLSASLGQGLLVHKAVKMKDQGADLDTIATWLEENKLHLVHLFTVDDLNHLYRGGRVSKGTAIIGTALGIKPVLHVDDEGRLIPLEKVRGRKASLAKLVNRMATLVPGWDNADVFISHGDCLEDAEYVADLIREQLGIQNVFIDYVGPVIGAHAGPGTIALFFMGDHR